MPALNGNAVITDGFGGCIIHKCRVTNITCCGKLAMSLKGKYASYMF